MQFLHPTFLWALAALAIPVIIHLFHFRRFKKVYFTNVHLLKEIKDATSTRSRLKNLLVLLARCLALAMIVFAFAQPLITKGDVDSKSKRAAQVFVDNSFSMEATRDEIPLITIAKDNAREIVNSYKESDLFLVMTHDLEAKHQRYVDKKTALSFVDEVAISPQVEELQTVLQVMDRLSADKEDYQQERYIISDFQQNISTFAEAIDTSISLSLLPIRAVQENNVALIDASWEAPLAMKDENNRLFISIANYGQESEEVELQMTYEGQQRPLGSIKVPAQSTVIDTATIRVDRTGWHNIDLQISDFPVTFDNQLYASFNIEDRIDILSIHEGKKNSYLTTAFSSIEYYQLQQSPKNSLRYETLSNMELIILDDLRDISSGLASELDKYVRAGGNLLVFSSLNADANSYNQLLGRMRLDRLSEKITQEKKVERINESAFVFSDVFETTKRNLRLPTSQSNWSLSETQATAKERLLRYRDGSAYLNQYSVDQGHVYLCTSGLNPEVQDLVLNAEIFIPMLYKMALSTGLRAPLSYTIGEDELIRSKPIDNTGNGGFLMTGSEEFIPGITSTKSASLIDVRDQVSKAGHFDLTQDDKVIKRLSFNYNNLESDVKYDDMATLAAPLGHDVTIADKAAMTNLASFITTRQEGIPLWRWCLMGGLLFLLLETLLIRYLK